MEEVIFKSFDISLFKSKDFFVIDSTIYNLYRTYFTKISNFYLLNACESNKSLNEINKILCKMIACKCNRETTIVAIGGGITGDIVGFTASIFMRGIRWINCPTSLLSMCDSCIGGKTAVNVCEIKNLVGTFYKAERVFLDINFLSSLNYEAWISGVGEIIKTSLAKAELFLELNKNIELLLNRDLYFTAKMIKECISLKKSIVDTDFYDLGLRQILNSGHTIGHSYEILENSRSHGEYVLWGLLAESYIFKESIEETYYYDLINLIKKVLLGKTKPKLAVNDIIFKAKLDKKNKDNEIAFSISTNLGNIKVMSLGLNELKKRLLEYENITN